MLVSNTAAVDEIGHTRALGGSPDLMRATGPRRPYSHHYSDGTVFTLNAIQYNPT